MLFPKVCGVDLGTDTIKIKDRSGKKFLYDKNVVALRNDRDVIAVGNDAYEYFSKRTHRTCRSSGPCRAA